MDKKLLTHNVPKTSAQICFTADNDALNCKIVAFNVVVNSKTESGARASSKIFAKDLTRYDWEQKYHMGNLVTSNSEYFAYALKGLQTNFCVRIMNRSTSSKTLIKNFLFNICDLAFASHSNNILGAIDVMGNFSIWELRNKGGSTLEYSILWSIKNQDKVSANCHRLKWQPIMEPPSSEGDEEIQPPPLLVVTNDKTVNVFDLELLTQEFDEQREVNLNEITKHFISIKDHNGIITDFDVSPDGQILATVAEDGCMKCFQLRFDTQPPSSRCLQNFRPHNASKLSTLLFCDNHIDPNFAESFWRFFVTGADHNRELKLWCASTWTLLQTIRFEREPQPMLKASIDPSGTYVVLTDVMREVMYILTIKKHQTRDKSGYAAFFTCTEYVLSSPVLSFSIWGVQSFDDEDEVLESEGAVLKMTSINTKTMQELEVRVNSDMFDPDRNLVPALKAATASTSSTEGNEKKSAVMAADNVEVDKVEEIDNSADDEDEIDSINEELSNNITDTLENLLKMDGLQIDDNAEETELLGPNSFGVENGDAPKSSKDVDASRRQKMDFDSWEDEAVDSVNHSTFTAVTSINNSVDNTAAARNDKTAAANIADSQAPLISFLNQEEERKSATSPINDGVMKFFMQTSLSASDKPEVLEQASGVSGTVNPVLNGGGLGDAANTGEKPASTKNSQSSSHAMKNSVETSEILKMLTSIMENQKRLEMRLDDISAKVQKKEIEREKLKDFVGEQVRNEIKTQVVPALNKAVKPFTDNMNNLVSQKLTSTDAVLKEQVKKMVSNKQIAENLGKHAATSVEAAVTQKCRDLFEQQLAPKFASSMESSTKQVGQIFSTGTSEYLRALDAHSKHVSDRQQTKIDAHITNVQSQLTANQAEIQKIVRDVLKSELTGFKAEIQQQLVATTKQFQTDLQTITNEQNKLIQATFRYLQRHTVAATPLPEGAQQNHVDVRPLVEEELKKNNFDKAFEISLTAADVQLVLHVCETIGPHMDKPAFKLSIPNILALLQQLSCNLSSCSRIELRIHALESALGKLDPVELVKYPKFDRSLAALEKELVKYSQVKGRGDMFYGKVRILTSATRELMTETKEMVSGGY